MNPRAPTLSSQSSNLRYIKFALVCVALWACIPVVSRIGQVNMDNHQFLFWSSLFSFLALLSLTLISGKWRTYKTYRAKDWLNTVLLGLLGAYFYFLLLFKGYAKGKGMEVLVIQYTWPVMIAALSPLLLKETVRLKTVAAVALGFAAVLVVLTKGHFSHFTVEEPALLAWVGLGAFCFAIFCILSKKIQLEPLSLTTVYFGVATVASFISMNVYSTFVIPSSLDTWLVLFISGALVNGISDAIWFWVLSKADASFMAPFTFLTPIVSTFYMLIIFQEGFEPAYAVGLALIVCAGLVNSLPQGVFKRSAIPGDVC